MPDENISETSSVPTKVEVQSASHFRFSLLSLLGVTTLAGFTSAVVFSKGWDPLERLLMAFWCAGLILGVSIGRARGKHGIFSAGLGAALGSGLATFLLHTGDYALVLTFVIVAGWVLAVSVAAVYHALLTGLIENCWRQRIVRQTAFAVGGLVIAGLIAWQAVKTPAWKPAWEQQVDFSFLNSHLPNIVLSPQGERLIMNAKSRDRDASWEGTVTAFDTEALELRIHRITPRGVIPEELGLPWNATPIFAPEGSRIASRCDEEVRLFDIGSDALIWKRTLELNSLEVVMHHQFTADGQQLLLTTHTPRIQRLHVIDLGGELPATTELFPFAGHLYVSDGGDRLVKFLDATDENNELSVEVVDLSSRETIRRLNDIAQIERPIFSLAGDRLALGSRVWELPSGTERPVGGKVLGLLTNGRTLVVDRDPPNFWRYYLPAWLQQMPFVRHLPTGERLSQLRISDKTGQTLLATPWLDNVHRVELSANQRVAVSASRKGQIRIWRVPE